MLDRQWNVAENIPIMKASRKANIIAIAKI